MLTIHLGTPPTSVDWQWTDDEKNFHRAGELTPQEFFARYVTIDLADYVCLVDDPRPEHPKGATLTVEHLGNVVGGEPVRYLNVDVAVAKRAAMESIVDGEPVWFGCDVAAQMQRKEGVWDARMFDYEGVYATGLAMDKETRVRHHASLMTHAMLLTGVDVLDGRSRRWRVENSWGDELGDDGFLHHGGLVVRRVRLRGGRPPGPHPRRPSRRARRRPDRAARLGPDGRPRPLLISTTRAPDPPTERTTVAPHFDAGDPHEHAERTGGPLRVGIGGPVGSGKTALVAALCRELREELSVAVVTNDIYTTEDADFLRRNAVLPDVRITAVQTGGCPHTAIRDDITANLDAIEDLVDANPPLDLVLVESGGDNLTATFSRGLIDVQVFVIDVAGGDKVPRKGGPGVTFSDLLVVNKTDLAPMVGASLQVMADDAAHVRGDRPTALISLRDDPAATTVLAWVREQLHARTARLAG